MSPEYPYQSLSYWLMIDGMPQGPFDLPTVEAQLDAGRISLSTIASLDDKNWSALGTLPPFGSSLNTATESPLTPAPVNISKAPTVIVLPPKTEPASASRIPATSDRSWKQGWLLLVGIGVGLLPLVLAIIMWPTNASEQLDKDDDSTLKGSNDPLASVSSSTTQKSTPEKSTLASGVQSLAHTKWVGKEHMFKLPVYLALEFIDNKDAAKTSKENGNLIRKTGDYLVQGNKVTVTIRYKKRVPSGKELYERVVYVGEIKGRTIVGEAYVEGGARWAFEVSQTKAAAPSKPKS